MNASLLEFPAEFPLKVMGRSEPGFRQLVLAAVEPHTGPLGPDRVRCRHSRDGNFIALTLELRVTSQAQLDAIYAALSGHERVLMVL
jgi:uncharacterized protein